VADPEIPGWAFETRRRARLLPTRSRPPESEASFDCFYLDTSRALWRLVRRLSEYEPNTFRVTDARGTDPLAFNGPAPIRNDRPWR